MSVRRTVLLALTALGVVVGAATAWACTTSAQVSVNTPDQPPQAGEQVSVTGRDFPFGGPVRVYWQSAGGGDRELAFDTTGASFARPLTVPADAQAGTHLVVAEGYEADGGGEPVGRAAATVQVAVADADSAEVASDGVADQLWSGATSEGSPSLSAADSAATGQPAGVGGQLALAAGLFAAGGLVLGTGTVAALRRRRVPAEAPAHRVG